MIRDCTDDLIAWLNELLLVDNAAVSALFFGNEGVPCNEQMAAHETVQVGTHPVTGKDRLRFLGLLNGFCGVIEEEGPHKGHGPITVELEPHVTADQGVPPRIIRFVRTEAEA